VVRAPLTAVNSITETTASGGMILPWFATAILAGGTSALVPRERLYHGLSCLCRNTDGERPSRRYNAHHDNNCTASP
jgi:H+/Cl- antiporter ClcA